MYKMKCTIPGRFVKLFGRSIHCLSKIGDELFLEALQSGLALRTVNSSRSAYASFVFLQAFFFDYDQEVHTIDDSNPDTLLKCKITMKSCLAIFKSLPTIDKTVEQCKIEFQPEKCRLVFVLYCKHGIIKTYNLSFQECERLEAVYQKDLCPNLIVAQCKVLQDTVVNFPNNCDEITLAVCPESVKVTNYVSDDPDPSKVVYTEMSLVPEEFDNFQIGVDTQVTFCLKELRAVLAFSEYVNQPLAMHFEHAGKPMVFSLSGDDLYESNFVMATLSDSKDPDTRQQTQTREESSANLSSTKQKHLTETKQSDQIKHRLLRGQEANKKNRKHISPEQTVPRVRNIAQEHCTIEREVGDDFFSESFPYKEMLIPKTNISKENKSQKSSQLNGSLLRSAAPKDVVDLTGIEDEMLPSTPPVAKKFKSSIFFAGAAHDGAAKQSEVLLAADTDDEDGD